MNHISITDIQGIRFGNAQNQQAMTGVTVVLFDRPNAGGIDISGGGPASRETGLLSPLSNPNSLNALVLSGGSAFGLDASTGVMGYLEEHHMGYHVLNTTIPLVCQSCIFDLGLGDGTTRPDAAMGYAACVDAEGNHPRSGIVGAGTGAAVGKVCGIGQGEKSGIGYAALEVNGLQVGAVAVVNAFGDIFDHQTGQKLARPHRLHQRRPGPLSAAGTPARRRQHHLGRCLYQRSLQSGGDEQDRFHGACRLRPLHQSGGHHDRRGHHLRLLPWGGSGGHQRRGCAGGGGAGVRHRGRGEKF